jgi:hypothetical protein
MHDVLVTDRGCRSEVADEEDWKSLRHSEIVPLASCSRTTPVVILYKALLHKFRVRVEGLASRV